MGRAEPDQAGRESRPIDSRAANRHDSPATVLARVIILGAIVFAPWALGSVNAWARFVLAMGLTVATLVWLGQLWRQRNERLLCLPWAIPLFIAVLLGFLQSVPLPQRIMSLVAPGALHWHEQLVPSEPERVVSGDESFIAALPTPSISLYPSSTRGVVLELWLYVAAFLLGCWYFRRAAAQLWLCWVVASVGAAIALFGMVQQLTWNGMIYWSVPLTQGGEPFGPFVNSNNAAGFLNICLAASLGLVLHFVRSSQLDLRRSPAEPYVHGLPGRGQRLLHIDRIGDVLTPLKLSVFGLTALILAGIFCSLSRGAFVATVGAAAVTLLAAMLTQRRTATFFTLASLTIVGFLLLAWVGMTETFQAEMATIWDEEPDGRVIHWQDTLAATKDLGIWGSGLGTYRFVSDLYEQHRNEGLYYHAENQYVETLVEMGIVGLLLLVSMIVLVAYSAWVVARRRDLASAAPLGLAGIYAIASQAIAACFDFGLYIPANALLFAVVCGSIVGRASFVGSASAAESGPAGPATPFSRWRRAASLALLFAVSCLLFGMTLEFLFCESLAARRRTEAFRTAQQAAAADSMAGMTDAISQTSAALRLRWDDAELHSRLAESYMVRYSIEARAMLEFPLGDASSDVPWADPFTLHVLARERSAGAVTALADVPMVRRNLVPAVRHLLLARQFCPLLRQVHVYLAELSFLIDAPNAEIANLKRARLLAAGDAELWFRIGLMEWHGGRPEKAFASWKRSLELSSRREQDVVELLIDRVTVEELVSKVLPASPERLLRLAQGRFAQAELESERSLLIRRAEGLLEEDRSNADGSWWHLRALAYRLSDAPESAIRAYERALELAPGEVAWRYELSRLLLENGQLDEALIHARRCARSQPTSNVYRSLLVEIHRAASYPSAPN